MGRKECTVDKWTRQVAIEVADKLELPRGCMLGCGGDWMGGLGDGLDRFDTSNRKLTDTERSSLFMQTKLSSLMMIALEGPETFQNEDLEFLCNKFRDMKERRISLCELKDLRF
ncbi:hypothetical protein DPMN_040431 [Dreissena polymorpha]|uniref:Uncharacterized protein n=1 Tax=Dreissena polymorpha TaxID=45954 RepID=A0A9D4CWW4_DREPO|nr:hypothetical protein DPMN_040431 [Dreissena polymorpha]